VTTYIDLRQAEMEEAELRLGEIRQS